MAALYGIIPALVTPRQQNRDEIDTDCLKKLVRHLIDSGVHGIFAASSTGEAPLLSQIQRLHLIETVVEVVNGAIPVLAGVGAPSTAQSIAYAQDAEKAGATHLSILPQHFVPLNADELYGYFAAVADSVSIPTVLYNYPARTSGQSISVETAGRLAAKHNVIGIKDSSGDLTNTIGYLSAAPNFGVFTGSESLIYPLLMLGGIGTICAGANVLPRKHVALYDAYKGGDHASAMAQQLSLSRLRKAFSQGTFPAAVKAAMEFALQPIGDPFLPVKPLSAEQKERVSEAMRNMV
jgi:4-hydroxy-tetrahydrodipicolinate synthase